MNCIPGEDTDTTSQEQERKDLVDRADSRRELGYFDEAYELYRAAEAIRGDLDVGIEMASLLIEQGRTPRAGVEIDRILKEYSTDNEELLAVARLFQAIADSTMTLDLKVPYELGVSYYKKFIEPFPIKEWKKRKVRMT